MRKSALVVTTIFEPAFLPGYLNAIASTNSKESTCIFIIPDRKTPNSVFERAEEARRDGFNVDCPSLKEQDDFLYRIGAPAGFIPYDSDNRRNVGFLMALDRGCDVLISIDDDNYCRTEGNFIGEHHAVGGLGDENLVRSSDGWFNLCTLLHGPDGPPIFPRGFPYAAQRQSRTVELMRPEQPIPIAMNAGLWLDEPDVDAVYRLCRRAKMTAFIGNSVLVGPDVWTPINTQNTALTRDAALTYYYVQMGFPLKGLQIDRFGDILSGYLSQKCIKHMGHAVRIGTPVVDHNRTPHNLFKDLYHELAGIVLIEDLLPWLRDVPLGGGTYLEAYEWLADGISEVASRFTGFIWDDGGREFLREMSKSMKTWSKLMRRIGI